MTSFPTPPQPPQPVAESRLQRMFGFRTRLYLTWATLFCLFAGFFLSFDLKFSIILDKLPNLVGLHLAPNGFLQGAALTLFVCVCSIFASLALGFATALARLSSSAVAFGIASVLAHHGLHLQLAKISTLGERVEDSFLISGAKLQQNKAQIEIETELLAALQPV